MIFEYSIIIIYTLALLIIFLYSLAQLNLLFNYLNVKKDDENLEKFNLLNDNEIPFVTIQLPVFNELYVMERLLHCISKINYPKDKLEIQVLDDSTDESVIITANKITELQKAGLDIKHIQRKNRKGFKAGALKEGLKIAKGDFIAIFDADFLPKDDWLFQTVPYFKNPEISVVQTRWTHINRNYSVLTRIQAFALDAHFTLEQIGRNVKNHFINFNGTGGIWRKKCIEDAGGWQADTLTEDLDLSYRAQMKGWKFKYLEDVPSPSELPVVMSAVKSQQFRWTKGGAETAKKNLAKVFRTNLKFTNKLHAIFHLTNSANFLLLLIASVVSIPLLWVKSMNPELNLYFNFGTIFLFGFMAISYFYWIANRFEPESSNKSYFLYFPIFIIFSMGFTLNNSLAVIEGLLGMKTPFVRTPKFNIIGANGSWKNNSYSSNSWTWTTLLEGFLSIYFLAGIVIGIAIGDYGLILFHLMMSLGYAGIFYYSIKKG